MFSDVLSQYDWDTTLKEIEAKRETDVLRALSKEYLSTDDFMALVSPAAAPFLEVMARRSREITVMRASLSRS